MNQFDRVFRLHGLLTGRRTGIAFDDLMIELRCSRATLRRCIDYLRNTLQAPLIHDQERGGYLYDAASAFELPGLWFSAEELSALLVLDEVIERQPFGLLSGTLRPLRARLDQLALAAGVGVEPWLTRLRLLRMAARPAGSQFSTVAEALARRRQLRIDYHARGDDRMAPRLVSPQRLTLYRDNWYLDAWCHTRNGLRTFALDRVIAAELFEEAARDLPAEQLDAVLATSYGIFSGTPTATAVLRFSAHAARWVAAETWHPQQEDTRGEDGALTRRVPFHRREELVMDILRHGPEVEVLEPPELRDAVIQKLRSALTAYGGPLFLEEPAPRRTRSRLGSSR